MRRLGAAVAVFLIVQSFGLDQSPAAEQKFIEISSNFANIQTGPDARALVVAKVKRGDIFRVSSEEGNWFRIYLFGHNERYIHKSFARYVPFQPSLPGSEAFRRVVFREILVAEAQAQQDAGKQFPLSWRGTAPVRGSESKNTEFHDQLLLELFGRYKIQPALYGAIISEGMNKGWSR